MICLLIIKDRKVKELEDIFERTRIIDMIEITNSINILSMLIILF